ncbi:MAG: SDR family oxidoreductase [Bacteroidetes bacterium]|nr:MAG: SDR family oxidoreductase [Bacteroidota bacterium]
MAQLFDLTGKVAVVTGGGSGIGRSIAQALAAQGAAVHILERDPAAGEGVAAAIAAAGGQAQVHACDVAQAQSVRAAMQAAGTGGIDILVNNAGIAHIGTVETTSETDFDRVYAVNVKGVFLCMQAAIPYMKGRGGSIINMASIASELGLPDRFAYSMSKGAVLTMTYTAARDLLPHHIRCNAVSPARVHTPFVDGFLRDNYPGREQEMYDTLAATQPIGRMARPEEVAHLVLYLASDEASFITGTNFPIDGGFIKLNT